MRSVPLDFYCKLCDARIFREEGYAQCDCWRIPTELLDAGVADYPDFWTKIYDNCTTSSDTVMTIERYLEIAIATPFKTVVYKGYEVIQFGPEIGEIIELDVEKDGASVVFYAFKGEMVRVEKYPDPAPDSHLESDYDDRTNLED